MRLFENSGNISILETSDFMIGDKVNNEITEMEKKDLICDESEVSNKSFDEIKDALRKTLHAMIDLDFQDGKLDSAINLFLAAKKFQISLTFNLNPNDVILIRNLTKNRISEEVLENIRKARNSKS